MLAALADAALLQEDAREGSGAAAGGSKKGGDSTLADRLAEAEQTVKAVFCECPSFERIVPTLLRDGVLRLPETCHFVPGVPVKPMLAKPTHGIHEILDRFSDVEFTCEYKYDGERAQIHVLDDGSVRVFSRNCEDNTERYPDITSTFKRHLRPGVKSAVFDCEAVAYDREAGKILPFQILSTRSRKAVAVEDVKIQARILAIEQEGYCVRTMLVDLTLDQSCLSEKRRACPLCLGERETPRSKRERGFFSYDVSRVIEPPPRAAQVCLFAFDCLFSDNEVLLRKPLTERREAMRKCLIETEGELMFAKAMTSRDVEELRVFLDDSIDHNTEGLIVKTLDATYEPSRRSLNWLKLKKDYLEGVGDSLDLVPIGAFHGRGKRTGVYGCAPALSLAAHPGGAPRRRWQRERARVAAPCAARGGWLCMGFIWGWREKGQLSSASRSAGLYLLIPFSSPFLFPPTLFPAGRSCSRAGTLTARSTRACARSERCGGAPSGTELELFCACCTMALASQRHAPLRADR